MISHSSNCSERSAGHVGADATRMRRSWTAKTPNSVRIVVWLIEEQSLNFFPPDFSDTWKRGLIVRTQAFRLVPVAVSHHRAGSNSVPRGNGSVPWSGLCGPGIYRSEPKQCHIRIWRRCEFSRLSMDRSCGRFQCFAGGRLSRVWARSPEARN